MAKGSVVNAEIASMREKNECFIVCMDECVCVQNVSFSMRGILLQGGYDE